MANWLVDSEGNDVFDSVNSPWNSPHLFDQIDVGRSFGFGGTVDEADDALGGVVNLPGMPGAIADSGNNAAEQLDEYQDYFETVGGFDGAGAGGVGAGGLFNVPALGMVAAAAVIGAALYLLAPVLELLTAILEE